MDDYIPFDPHRKVPAFTNSQGNKMWPIILEKVWAKIHGSYEYCNSGHSLLAFSFLTGAPCLYYDHGHKEGEELWLQIKESDKSLSIINASNSKDR